MWCQWMHSPFPRASSVPHPSGSWTSLLGAFLITYSHYCYCLAYKMHPLNVTLLEYKSDDVTLPAQNHYILEWNPKFLPQAVRSSGSSSHLQTHLELLSLSHSMPPLVCLPTRQPLFYLICVCFFSKCGNLPHSPSGYLYSSQMSPAQVASLISILLPLEPFSQWAVILCICLFSNNYSSFWGRASKPLLSPQHQATAWNRADT